MTTTAVRKNEQIVSEATERILNDADFDAVDELYASDFVSHGGPADGVRGTDGFREFQETLHGAFPDLHVETELTISDDEFVVNLNRYSGTHEGEFVGIPATGKEATVTGILISRIEDGKIAENWGEVDMLGLMQQVGLIDEPAA